MTDLKELIEREMAGFLDWSVYNKSIVTTTNAKRFAEHVARLYAAPQPAPDVSALVEALVAILEHDSPINIVDTATATERDIFDIARAALAAHGEQGGEV